jgi:hypothetical protein
LWKFCGCSNYSGIFQPAALRLRQLQQHSLAGTILRPRGCGNCSGTFQPAALRLQQLQRHSFSGTSLRHCGCGNFSGTPSAALRLRHLQEYPSDCSPTPVAAANCSGIYQPAVLRLRQLQRHPCALLSMRSGGFGSESFKP